MPHKALDWFCNLSVHEGNFVQIKGLEYMSVVRSREIVCIQEVRKVLIKQSVLCELSTVWSVSASGRVCYTVGLHSMYDLKKVKQ